MAESKPEEYAGPRAKYGSMCTACRKRINVGDPMASHRTTMAYVHRACEEGPPPDGWDEKYKEIVKLRDDRVIREVAKGMHILVSEKGRFKDRDMMARQIAAYGCLRDVDYRNALALATRKPGEAPQPVTATAQLDETFVRETIKGYLREDAGFVAEEKIRELAEKHLVDATHSVFEYLKELKKDVMKGRPVTVHDRVGEYTPDGGVLPQCFDRVLQLCSQRVNVMLVGPAGCGKTYLAGEVAKALRTKAYPKGLPYYGVSCSVGMSEAQLAGYLLPSGAGGQFEYFMSLFVRAYTEGGLFLFDEFDAADGNTLVFVNAALANSHMFVAQKLGGQIIQKHEDFVCMAAANTYGLGGDAMYVSRNQLDKATLTRFAMGTVTMDYDDKVEEALIDPKVLEWGRKVRASIKKHGLMQVMSTRDMIYATTMKKAYDWQRADWELGYFAAWSEDERAKVVRD